MPQQAKKNLNQFPFPFGSGKSSTSQAAQRCLQKPFIWLILKKFCFGTAIRWPPPPEWGVQHRNPPTTPTHPPTGRGSLRPASKKRTQHGSEMGMHSPALEHLLILLGLGVDELVLADGHFSLGLLVQQLVIEGHDGLWGAHRVLSNKTDFDTKTIAKMPGKKLKMLKKFFFKKVILGEFFRPPVEDFFLVFLTVTFEITDWPVWKEQLPAKPMYELHVGTNWNKLECRFLCLMCAEKTLICTRGIEPGAKMWTAGPYRHTHSCCSGWANCGPGCRGPWRQAGRKVFLGKVCPNNFVLHASLGRCAGIFKEPWKTSPKTSIFLPKKCLECLEEFLNLENIILSKFSPAKQKELEKSRQKKQPNPEKKIISGIVGTLPTQTRKKGVFFNFVSYWTWFNAQVALALSLEKRIFKKV